MSPRGALDDALRLVAVGAATAARVLTVRVALLAVGIGIVCGLATSGLAAPRFAPGVLSRAVPLAAALLVLPLLAGRLTSERALGYERLVAVRPLPSVVWATGRLAGGLVGAAGLTGLLAAAALWTAGSVPVPRVLVAKSDDLSQWRFDLPAGTTGPFELEFETLACYRTSVGVNVQLRRGTGRRTIQRTFRPRRVVRVRFDELRGERGDLRVTLVPQSGVVLSDAPPRLTLGSEPLSARGFPIDARARRSLLLAVVAALAAACAFRFETSCLAGLLGLSVDGPERGLALLGVVAWLWIVAVWGTALVRRQAMP